MSDIQKITEYFKQSLIDAERLAPKDKDILPVLGSNKDQKASNPYVALDRSIWVRGELPQGLTNAIFKIKQPKNKPPLTVVELVVFPRVDLKQFEGGSGASMQRRVFLPLVTHVRLEENGQLRPSAKVPWIPREFLAPNQSATEPFAQVGDADNFLTHNPFEGIETWQQFTRYCNDFLTAVSNADTSSAAQVSEDVGNLIFKLDLHDEYAVTTQSLIQMDVPISGAIEKPLKVLEFLIKNGGWPKLYKSYGSLTSVPQEKHFNLQNESELAKQHCGQMTGEFPLAPNQRNALHHLSRLKDGEILAVNGPPGTGKTTLLRSVVAQLWTQAALAEGEPPIVIATSNNNTAVTNILTSFARIDEKGVDPSLEGRWLPEVDSYGLFFCSGERANSANSFRYSGPKGEGCMQHWQTQEFVDFAEKEFIKRHNNWQPTKHIVKLAEAKITLHQALLAENQKVNDGYDKLQRFQQLNQKIQAEFGGLEELTESIVVQEQKILALHSHLKQWKKREGDLYGLWSERSFFVSLLMWLPPIARSENYKTARLLKSWEINQDAYNDKNAQQSIDLKVRDIQQLLAQSQPQVQLKQELVNTFETATKALKRWIDLHARKPLHSASQQELVHQIVDCVLRFRLFKLSTHYWECRWLIEMKEFLASKDEDKKSPIKLRRKLLRYAKLTPCFVSTFYMAPGMLMAYEKQDQVWMDLPLLGGADLLIIDEAGQASPEVAAACFALAKKALVVGDTDQIEPVWGLPASLDRSNLKLFSLLETEQSYSDFWVSSGLQASNGNVMRIAQRQSKVHQFQNLQRGLYLTEHRRCFDNIVTYCNELVYEGVLEPIRGHPKSPVPWGNMSMVNVFGASKTYGGSRVNEQEAHEISKWLADQAPTLLNYARQTRPEWHLKSDSEVLALAVGIVTPFKRQATLISRKLSALNIQNVTVGTVHALQGAERILILFSSVYGAGDESSGKFYDMGKNMLNVAVSRAQDAFVVFGNPDVFGKSNASSPSGLLRRHLH
jgi:energy-coupling factor transporter ATP-binding protein EcfA2